MKIFPVKLFSNFDRVRNLYKIISNQSPKNIENLSSDVVVFGKNEPLRKGRSICDMLSE